MFFLFKHKLENRKWYHIIAWWEIRRIPFNLIILLCGIISIFLLSLVVKGAGDFIQPLAIVSFAFLTNLFYTSGWIGELIVKLDKRNSNKWGLKAFKTGLIFSICCTFVPTIIFAIGGVFQGEKLSSPYSHFATKQPMHHQLVGTYKINLNKADYLTEEDKAKQPQIILFPDSTFNVSNFPIFGLFENYDLCNGQGTWKIEKPSSSLTWTLFFEYKILINTQTNKKKDLFITTYSIYGNDPPFQIYDIVSDPDEWAGILYEKAK